LLEDLRALVEFAHAGSIAGAADRLFRTPSAITRQVQRLEAALGAELLDQMGLAMAAKLVCKIACGRTTHSAPRRRLLGESDDPLHRVDTDTRQEPRRAFGLLATLPTCAQGSGRQFWVGQGSDTLGWPRRRSMIWIIESALDVTIRRAQPHH
jgi:hypothetical protein